LGNDANDGLSAGTAFKTLTKAAAAAQKSNVKRITVLDTLDATSEDSKGDSVFTISDSGREEILIRGGGGPDGVSQGELRGGNGRRVLEITGNSRIRIENLLISGGDTAGNGGGVHVSGAVLTLGTGVLVSNNKAAEGGGLYVLRGTLNLESDAAISGNTVSSDEGGGAVIYRGIFTMSGNTLISGNSGGGVVLWYTSASMLGDSAIEANRCEFDGGGVAAYESQISLRRNARISDNHAGRNGGGFFSQGLIETPKTPFQGASLLLTGNAVISNNQTGSDGGGIYGNNSTVTLQGGVRVAGNLSGDQGGGVYLTDGSKLTLEERGGFVNNTAASGGGLCVDTDSVAVIQGNVHIRGNRSIGDAQGGGGFCVRNDGSIIMRGGEVRNNEAGKGGGVYIEGGSLTYTGGIIVENTAQDGGGIYVTSGSANIGSMALVRGNTAERGGGVYLVASSSDLAGVLNLEGVIQRNKAEEGGGVYVENNMRELYRPLEGAVVEDNEPDNVSLFMEEYEDE
jgi:hypothetical protein